MKRRVTKRRRYELPRSGARRRYWKHLFWVIPLIAVDVFLFRWLLHRPDPEGPAPELVAPAPAAPVSPWMALRFPTAQTALLDPSTTGVFQPTASGKPVSALYGSVRTAEHGGSLMASFHEGVDIAAMARDRHGRPLDTVHAVADGRVAHVNRVAGNSNYGIYVVLLHDDPAIGEVFTLYAHLASVESGLHRGSPVRAGQTLGVMGNTSSSPMPMARAHLHFEIGLVMSDRFSQLYRMKKLKPDHGNFHGHNLFGVDPLPVFEGRRQNPEFDFLAHVRTIPAAVELVARAKRQPDFFRRYPALWDGAPHDGGPVFLAVSECGMPLRGRNATGEESAALGRGRAKVVRVDDAALGRNGSRLVARTRDGWKLASNGERWLDIVTF